MSRYPIPGEALDDRHAIVGTAGSGKTYAAGTAVERILARRGRVIVPDPLGVWYGLRLLADGKTASPFNVVIFGGPHGDLPIHEHAGALVGETVAGMAESAIIDLSQFGTKAAERRFMLAFLTALYRKASGEPVHLIFDEADMWAPQRLLDKEGEAAKLQGMMETIVRRGRIKGFIPWLITQRPAVLSKDVLSQADGLIAMKLTSSQDRAAIGGWIEGQADAADGKRILASLPAMPRGHGVVWVPGRGILDTVAFPPKQTFDSSRTPKRGETVKATTLAPIDLGALRDKLASVEQQAVENDPKRLKARVAALERDLQKAGNAVHKPDQAAISVAYAEGLRDGGRMERDRADRLLRATDASLASIEEVVGNIRRAIGEAVNAPSAPESAKPAPKYSDPIPAAAKSTPSRRPAAPGEKMPAVNRAFLTALAQQGRPLTRNQLAIFAGYSAKSRHVDNTLAALRSAGHVIGGRDAITITDAGVEALGPFEPLPSGPALQDYWIGQVDKAAGVFLRVICDAYPRSLTRDQVAERAGYSPTSRHVDNTLAQLRSRDLVTGGRDGITASADLFGDGR